MPVLSAKKKPRMSSSSAAAVQGSANAAIIAGYGASGILVAFAARQNPLAIIACAILLGGIEASGSLLQRRLGLPDATTLILEGILFTSLLAWEALTPRIVAWRLRLNERALQTQGALQHG